MLYGGLSTVLGMEGVFFVFLWCFWAFWGAPEARVPYLEASASASSTTSFLVTLVRPYLVNSRNFLSQMESSLKYGSSSELD